MNRRGFLRGLLSSTAAVVVAPACVMDELDELLDRQRPPKTFFDMGRGSGSALDHLDPATWTLLFGAAATAIMGGMMAVYGRKERTRKAGEALAMQSAVPILSGATP